MKRIKITNQTKINTKQNKINYKTIYQPEHHLSPCQRLPLETIRSYHFSIFDTLREMHPLYL